MSLQEYQLLTSRTNADLGSPAINAAHCVLGIVGEWYEFLEALEDNDGVEIIKEGGDVCWYLSEIANIFGITLEIKIDEDNSFNYHQSRLAEQIKKFLAYGKQVNIADVEKNLNGMLSHIYVKFLNLGIPMSIVYTTNTTKLQKRFPEKFEAALAIAQNDAK